MALTDMVIMPGADYQAACDKLREKTGTTDAIKSGDWAGLLDSVGGGDIDALIDRSITEVSSETVESIGDSAFNGCSKLTAVDFPVATSIGSYAFYSCSALTAVDFPAATSIGTNAFYSCSALTTVDFPAATSIGSYAFNSCSKLTTLILRSETMATLSNKNAFNNTPIASGTGYIYVPAALVDTYKAATYWSTYAAQFRSLEDYTVDGTTTGALDETKIAA